MRLASLARGRSLPMLAAVFAAVRVASAQSAAEPLVSALVDRVAPDDVRVRAVRPAAPLTVDGRLEEPVYAAIEPLTDFIQQEPRQGELATEKTEAWILFDDSSVHVAARCWDSQPEREVANTPAAASCSSSTATDGIRAPRAFRHCSIAPWR